MRFWATPVVVASERSFDTLRLRQVGSILQIDELDLIDYSLLIGKPTVNQNIIGLNVY